MHFDSQNSNIHKLGVNSHLLLVSVPLDERVVALVILSSSLMTQLAFIPAATHLIKMEGAFLSIRLSTAF